MIDRSRPEPPVHQSHLFTLRLWQEDLGGGQTDWRGKIQHVNSGEVRYFRDWQVLEDFLEESALRNCQEGNPMDE